MEALGLLVRLAATPAIFEPFRNPADKDQVCDCLLKLLEVMGDRKREAKRNHTTVLESTLPKLWILTPTASATLLSGFGAIPKADWLAGVHFLPKTLRTAIVAIHQLPKTPETLWLRILGRGRVQNQAIDELEALPSHHPFRQLALELLYNLQKNLLIAQNPEQEDRELVMRLAPLYQQDRELAKLEGLQEGRLEGQREGIKQGERLVVENLLLVRFGSVDDQLQAIIDAVLALSPAEFTPLLMQLSREQLIARFAQQS